LPFSSIVCWGVLPEELLVYLYLVLAHRHHCTYTHSSIAVTFSLIYNIQSMEIMSKCSVCSWCPTNLTSSIMPIDCASTLVKFPSILKHSLLSLKFMVTFHIPSNTSDLLPNWVLQHMYPFPDILSGGLVMILCNFAAYISSLYPQI